MHLMVKFGFSFGCLGLFALGVWDVLLNFEKNRCEMTYMFEYPDYVVRGKGVALCKLLRA